MSNGNNDDFASEDAGHGEGTPLESGKPAVAAAPGKMLIVLVFAAVLIFIVVRSLFFSSDKPAPAVQPKQGKEQVSSSSKSSSSEMSIPQGALPAPPPVEALPAPPLPPAPPAPVVTPPVPELRSNKTPTNEALQARIKSSMIISGGSGKSVLGGKSQAKAVAASNDPNSAFAQNIAQSDIGGTVEASKISNLNITIAQGKIIHAILETAINSDLPGVIRAIVSHDIYAEAGKDVLIPKGSRLIGTYNSAVRRGQARVFIVWTRVIRPDGIDMAINSPGTDALGRAGVTGDVDNKYFEIFSSAILTSSMDIGIAAAGQALFGNQQQTTTTSGGGTTTTSSPSATAVQEAVQNFGDVGKSIVGSTLSLAPTINIDQGTPIEVLVNHDLVFPSGITSRAHFVE
jgi:type IV secretion system protein VirB10